MEIAFCNRNQSCVNMAQQILRYWTKIFYLNISLISHLKWQMRLLVNLSLGITMSLKPHEWAKALINDTFTQLSCNRIKNQVERVSRYFCKLHLNTKCRNICKRTLFCERQKQFLVSYSAYDVIWTTRMCVSKGVPGDSQIEPIHQEMCKKCRIVWQGTNKNGTIFG